LERGGDAGAAAEGGGGGAEQSRGRHGRKLELEVWALGLMRLFLSFFRLAAQVLFQAEYKARASWALASYNFDHADFLACPTTLKICSKKGPDSKYINATMIIQILYPSRTSMCV
jgi:hypothetical protein